MSAQKFPRHRSRPPTFIGRVFVQPHECHHHAVACVCLYSSSGSCKTNLTAPQGAVVLQILAELCLTALCRAVPGRAVCDRSFSYYGSFWSYIFQLLLELSYRSLQSCVLQLLTALLQLLGELLWLAASTELWLTGLCRAVCYGSLQSCALQLLQSCVLELLTELCLAVPCRDARTHTLPQPPGSLLVVDAVYS